MSRSLLADLLNEQTVMNAWKTVLHVNALLTGNIIGTDLSPHRWKGQLIQWTKYSFGINNEIIVSRALIHTLIKGIYYLITCKGISFVGEIAIGVSTGIFITVSSGMVILILCACVIWKQKASECNLLLFCA